MGLWLLFCVVGFNGFCYGYLYWRFVVFVTSFLLLSLCGLFWVGWLFCVVRWLRWTLFTGFEFWFSLASAVCCLFPVVGFVLFCGCVLLVLAWFSYWFVDFPLVGCLMLSLHLGFTCARLIRLCRLVLWVCCSGLEFSDCFP